MLIPLPTYATANRTPACDYAINYTPDPNTGSTADSLASFTINGANMEFSTDEEAAAGQIYTLKVSSDFGQGTPLNPLTEYLPTSDH